MREYEIPQRGRPKKRLEPLTNEYERLTDEYERPMFINSWMNKKKRKNNPLLWQYIKQHEDFYPGIIHPSKYSSLDFIKNGKKMYLGTIKTNNINDKPNNNSILPLYLNSATVLDNHFQEFQRVSNNFIDSVKDLDYENVTVQQLKFIMKEFGLNHAGKKQELIERVKHTLRVIKSKGREEKKEEKDFNFLFF